MNGVQVALPAMRSPSRAGSHKAHLWNANLRRLRRARLYCEPSGQLRVCVAARLIQFDAVQDGVAQVGSLAKRSDALLRQLWRLEDMPKAATLVEMTKV
jgi:hypothetical protein